MYEFKGMFVPQRIMGGMKRYVDHGIEPGGFLKAVIANDLQQAVSLADDEVIHNIPAIVGWFYNEAPSACWGTEDSCVKWLAYIKEKQRG